MISVNAAVSSLIPWALRYCRLLRQQFELVEIVPVPHHHTLTTCLHTLADSCLWVRLNNFDVGELKHLFGEHRVVVFVEYDTQNACLDDHLRAELAWERRCVDCTTHSARTACLDHS